MPITPDEYTYPFDPTGTAPSNIVTGEVHVITQQNHRDYSFIVPTFAPFFAEGVEIIFTDVDGNPIPLIEGTDYYFGHHFLAASRAISKQVYGSISFITKDFKGTMSLGYQTLGGKWTYDQAYLNQLMTNIISNPRSSSWDSIVELPALFPVLNHEWNLIDMVGMSHVVAGLFGIEEALRDPTGEGTGGSGSQMMDHILNNQNPHYTTKLQVGLGNVQNYGMATQLEAEAGNADNKYMSPLLVKQAISVLANAVIENHKLNINNPHQTTKTHVGLSDVQNYGMATQLEAEVGNVANKYMSPLLVKQAISVLANAVIENHKADVANPHQTTKAQVGLGNVPNYTMASQLEAEAGVSNTTFMSPQLVAAFVNSKISGGISEHIADYNNPHQVTASQTGAYTVEQVNALLFNKLNVSDTAADTSKTFGLTLPELSANILTGKASDAYDSDKLDGKTYQELLESISAFGVGNADELNGSNLADIYSSVPFMSDVARQTIALNIPAIAGVAEVWTLLFKVGQIQKTDAQLILAGCDLAGEANSSLFAINASGRNNLLKVCNLTGIDTSSVFGYTVSPDLSETSIWLKSSTNRLQISMTELSRNIAIYQNSELVDFNNTGIYVPANVVSVEPVGIIYVDDSSVQKDVADHLDNLTNPHQTTKAQVGLGDVQNYPIATTLQAQIGTDNLTYTTPLRVNEAIAALVGNRITTLEAQVSDILTELTTVFNTATV